MSVAMFWSTGEAPVVVIGAFKALGSSQGLRDGHREFTNSALWWHLTEWCDFWSPVFRSTCFYMWSSPISVICFFSCLALHCSKCQSSSAVIRLSGSRASARKLLEIEPKKNGCMLHAGSNSKIWWFLLVRCVRAFSPANPRSASLAAQKESGNRKQTHGAELWKHVKRIPI